MSFDELDDWILPVIIIIVIGFIIYSSYHPVEQPCEFQDTPIYSLRTNEAVTGGFFLGIGGFGSTTYYYVYEANMDGYILKKYNADHMRLVEANTTPVHRIVKNNIGCINTLPLDGSLIIPPGTIKIEYRVNN